MEVDPPKTSKKSWKRFQSTPITYKSLSRSMRNAERATTKHAHKFIIQRLGNVRASRKVIVLWLVAVGAVLLGTIVQYWLHERSLTIVAAQPGGTYAEGVLGTIDTLDPLFSTNNAELSANQLIFSSLYNYDKTGSLRPDVAESMSIDKTSKIYTVKIREDVKWHDGENLTAKDVHFTIQTIKNPASTVNSVLRANWMDIKTKLVDSYTVQFILPSRYAAFPGALTFPIIPEHILSDVPASTIGQSAFSRSPIGSGPFEFKLLQIVRQDIGRKILYLTANDKYYRGAPKLNRFELHTYDTNAQLLRALKTSEVAAIANVDVSDEDLDESAYDIDYYSINNGVYLLLNMNNSILKDKNVRTALRSAIDTDKVRDAARGNVKSLHLPYIGTQVDSVKLPNAPGYDVERAKKLLNEAKWKLPKDSTTRVKNGKELNLRITTVEDGQNERVVAELQRQLSQVGVTVQVELIDISSPSAGFVQNILQPRNYDMLLHELPIGSDPDVYSYWHSSQTGISGYNFANYENDTADAALTSARDRVEKRLRDIKYAAFARQWLNDVPAVGLYQQSMTYVTKKSAKAMNPSSNLVTASSRYSDVSRWSINDGTVYKTP